MSQSGDNGNPSDDSRVSQLPANLALPEPPQPRQPQSLQDLLRYSTEVTAAAGASSSNTSRRPLDEESKQFLEKAIKDMSVDIIGELKRSIKILQNINHISEEFEDSTDYEIAVDSILEYLENPDIANDFYKIGGFSVLNLCLNSCNSSLRWRGAELVATLSQNNHFCQDKILELAILPNLLGMIDNDISDTVKVKSMYAISCLVRANQKAAKEFADADGYSLLLRALQSDVIKLNIKAAFLLGVLCTQNPEIKDELVRMGYVEQLVGQTALCMQNETEEQAELLDHLLSALLSLVQDHEPSQLICQNPDLQFVETMNYVLENTEGKDDCRMENMNAKMLLQIIVKEQYCSMDEER